MGAIVSPSRTNPAAVASIALYLPILPTAAPLAHDSEEESSLISELERHKAQLADDELELVNLRAELLDVEARHRALIAQRCAERDQLRAELAECQLRQAPFDPGLRDARDAAKARAGRAAEEARPVVPAAPKRSKPTEELKRLFRRAARRVHPDLGSTDADRLERTKQMAHVNELYQEGDLAGLQRFLDQLEGLSTATDMGTGPSRVALLRMQLKQVTLRIAQVRSELEALRHSPLGRLSEQIALARTRGRELLDEMAAEIDVQIATLRRHLAACHNDGVQA